MNRYFLPLKQTLIPGFMLFSSLLFAAQNSSKKEKILEKKIQPKAEEKLDLVERIRLVFKFGNAGQVRESLGKLISLKEEEQKSLIPQMKELLQSNDKSIQIALIQSIGDVKWTDLDSDIVKYLESEESQVVTTTANVIHRKNIREAIEPLKAKLQKFDYTISDNHINDLLNAYAGFKDPSLQDLMFNKLKDDGVLNTYKIFILKYLGSLESGQDEIKKYLLDLVNNEKADLNMRIYAVRALGNMNFMDARESFKKKLDEIESLTDLNKKRDLFNFRLELISALVKLKDEGVKSLLIQMTRDDDELVRIRAIRRLAEFKSGEFTDLLEYKIKYDSSLAVQKEAKKALDIIHGKKNEGSDDAP